MYFRPGLGVRLCCLEQGLSSPLLLLNACRSLMPSRSTCLKLWRFRLLFCCCLARAIWQLSVVPNCCCLNTLQDGSSITATNRLRTGSENMQEIPHVHIMQIRMQLIQFSLLLECTVLQLDHYLARATWSPQEGCVAMFWWLGRRCPRELLVSGFQGRSTMWG